MTPTEKFKTTLATSETFAGQIFSDDELAQFARYYELTLKWNAKIPLTTITEPDEFAERHILEAAFLRQHLATTTQEVWDLGTGLGIPGLVIAILCPFLRVKLVESNRKKCIFLEEAAFQLGLASVKVLNQRIENLESPDQTVCLTGRAIDGMNSLIPRIVKLGVSAGQILILGTIETEAVVRLHLSDERKLTRFALPNRETSCLLSIE
ncbi:MAG: 16S rRNA (guanine(527)-N(7))-methyltransferase RsmG [Acidobacteria bacterium]|nr:16S rRNA (guanine(527)-N(7))-methyltransferase RsmG [Acidobacteriota bacterium]